MDEKKEIELTKDQLEEVNGGIINRSKVLQNIPPCTGFKRCAADPTHVFAQSHDACPICGSKEFTLTSS